MDWQQVASLVIVGTTFALLIRGAMVPRKHSGGDCARCVHGAAHGSAFVQFEKQNKG
jgi:hypothetical protein